MSHHNDHVHTTPRPLQSRMRREPYAAVVGIIDPNSERAISGRSGDHLQFYVQVGVGVRYQVDVNTQSKDGSSIQHYVADQTPASGDQPAGTPEYGVFPDAALSYRGLGLTDDLFQSINFSRLDFLLEAALSQSVAVAVYGHTFDDGGDDGKGVHDTHLFTGAGNQDGAVSIFVKDPESGLLKRTWFFFKFQEDRI
jgi:hypothetical protein